MKIKYWLYRKFPSWTNFLFRKKRKGFSIKTHVEIPYHSQYGQDKIINERIFGSKKNGFFVDIGANDGITGSNTYFFEKELSWKGVCIEPQPDIFKKLAKNRKSECHNCAVSSKSGKAKFLKVGHADMLSGLVDHMDTSHLSRVEREGEASSTGVIDVDCKTFNQVVGENFNIDLLSIDVEGADFSILSSIDFDRYKIGCIAIENNSQENKIYKFLREHAFALRYVAGDEIYVNELLISH